jgi:sec-independent protein translocase protein TatA
MNFGFGELVLVLVIVLVLFGASRLPALGSGLGKAIRGFKDAVSGDGTAPPPAPKEEKKELPPDAGAQR